MSTENKIEVVLLIISLILWLFLFAIKFVDYVLDKSATPTASAWAVLICCPVLITLTIFRIISIIRKVVDR